jgi:hypothetical protein
MTPEEFWSILHAVPEQKPIYYRLYYSDDGAPIAYSMEDLPGKYIDITPEEYCSSNFRVRVVNGKIVPLPSFVPSKLAPSTTGTACHPSDVSIVVNSELPHQCWKLND